MIKLSKNENETAFQSHVKGSRIHLYRLVRQSPKALASYKLVADLEFMPILLLQPSECQD